MPNTGFNLEKVAVVVMARFYFEQDVSMIKVEAYLNSLFFSTLISLLNLNSSKQKDWMMTKSLKS